MGCCIVLLLLFSLPRLGLFFLWLQGYLLVLESPILAVLGFIFLPWTTIAYAFCMHHGGVKDWGIVLIVIAVMADMGISIFGHRSRRRD